VVLEFASDQGLAPGPVAKIASGGELSRLILALRLASGTSDASIIAFDEIDAGTGGATALVMGRKLKDLAAGRQVFCVTHLPQVAAYAETHFVVRRDGNTAVVSEVKGDERLEELSRMLAGLPDSERGREHAAELLTIAGAS
jgi:DNA repair protein RecN (Recombination protein N)